MRKIKTKNYTKMLIILFASIVLISTTTVIYAKYIFENEFCIANLDIDRTKPQIELVEVKNTNTGYEKYANKTHTISIKVKITDKNLKDVFLDENYVKIKIDDIYVKNENVELNKVEDIENKKIYEIKLNNLIQNGKLKLEFSEGTAIDMGDLKSEFKEIDTNIVIDNIAPEGTFEENKISGGKINGIITFNERVKELEGWDFLEDKLKAQKEFTNNISYELPIQDYAGNKSIVEVNITQATYINIIYASHNSGVGWSFGYGNYDIAGKEAIIKKPKYKTEALAFNISGNIDEDFVQARAYIHTYWGEGSKGKCTTSGLIYKYGYNPTSTSYKSMASTDLVKINNKRYFQLGGGGINSYVNGDANGNNIIPKEIATQYLYGVSGIKFKLKDYSQFSIIYQIYIDQIGWIESCSDGQECMYEKTKPMSAFRMALVPKTEKKYVLDTWNKDIGTSNMK